MRKNRVKYILTTLLVLILGISFSQDSKLVSGTWHKIEVKSYGLCKITYDQLNQMGISNPKNIQVYGYGGIIPQANSSFRYEDLIENSIYVNGESDGNLNSGDYVLFYAQGPNEIYLNNDKPEVEYNPYSSSSFYFITEGNSPGKRISSTTQETVTGGSLTSLPYKFHFEESLNSVVGSGRNWVGQSFRFENTLEWSFDLTDLQNSETVDLRMSYVGGSQKFSLQMSTYINGDLQRVSSFGKVPDTPYGVKATTLNHDFNLTLSDDELDLKAIFNNNSDLSASGYLDYVSVLYERELNLNRSTYFKVPLASRNSTINLLNTGSNKEVWDVTDLSNVRSLPISSSSVNIGEATSDLLLVNPSSFISADYKGTVTNQNLHGLEAPELLIVTNKEFESVANDFKDFKQNEKGIVTQVVYVDEIYNEFSSGSQDVSAIRDFVKHLYDKGGLKYLLLMGDCSYDYRNVLSNNTNYVPVYESRESLDNVDSYSSDDFYGFLDENEGVWNESGTSNERLDIGIGRLPISSNEEGREYLKKLQNYSDNANALGTWRNEILFVADDGDGNLHMRHANEISTALEARNPSLNISRLFIDSYTQISTSSGQKVPSVNEVIDRKMDEGALIVNFSGHGSEEQWTQEEILKFDQIESYDNLEGLPFFITATCEFGRYDNPVLRSGAERLLLNPSGGAIGLMTTTRPVFAQSNKAINESFYERVFQRGEDGSFSTLGETFIDTKNNSVSGVNNRNFSLLGDPSMKLAFPDYQVKVDSINNVEVINSDTIMALEKVSFSGKVYTPSGTFDSTFNGLLRVRVYDKKTELTTLGQNDAAPFVYAELNSVIFDGNTVIKNGCYSVEFVVPKDISYNFGEGKFSFYAVSDDKSRDASGSFEDIIIGGGVSGFIDDSPPEVELFMNDETFVDGGTVGVNPVFIAKIQDENGINTTNTGIGHEMTLVLNGNEQDVIVLNDFYESVENTFTKGEVIYPMFDLPFGEHTLTFKVWDVNNNSTEERINIVVTEKAEIHPYPNPFSDEVVIYIDQPRMEVGGTVEVKVFDRTGRQIWQEKTEFDEFTSVIEEVKWDGRKESGELIEDGLYFIQASLRYNDSEGDITEKGKVILQK